ncbi:MAG TPA: SH3 domain-containing protein [Spirochaetota bacterium]|nr:SH3 domain-containing protein [Spirochaetota bacterium]HPS87421.1 SH3 domain-containing protein [Spirochaetota bacterium]
MFKKSAIISAIILGIVICITAVYFLTRGETVESAIRDYEDGDYVDAIVSLNSFVKTANYEDGEKIYYYRCKSLNTLAEELEDDYDDELKDASLENKDKPEFDKYKQKIEKKLNSINSKTGGDLEFIPAAKKSRIVPKGLFYNEFASRYRGSQFIEDLDFYEIKKAMASDQTRLFDHMNRFYKKYPGTNYTPQMISIIFDAIRDGAAGMEANSEFLKNIIYNYAAKYPTSQEVSRLYISAGDSVNLRNSPGVTGAPAGKTVKDELLIQIEKSMDMMQVGDTRDYWYRVSTLRGVKGWIFGKFLKPLDIQSITTSNQMEIWSVEDYFTAWSDSNTPENWNHIKDADAGAVSFKKLPSGNIVVFSSKGIATTGLYSRLNTSRTFKIMVRGRFISGAPVILAVYSIERGENYYIKLESEKVDVNGRSIPIHATDWHNYELASEDGKYATFSIDGQMVSGRIPSVTDSTFSDRGVYMLFQYAGGVSSCEVEFIKIK